MSGSHSALAIMFGREGAALFRNGVAMFNRGNHWEAHEVFEEVWRSADGDAKIFAQGFVQAAAAFSYIRRKRYESIIYLFDKSIEKLRATANLFPDAHIDELMADVTRARSEVLRVGERGLDQFDPALYPRIRFSYQRPRRKDKGRVHKAASGDG